MTELVVDYDLPFMYTGTYAAAPTDFREVALDIGRFGRRMRVADGSCPRVVVPELSPQGRWHVHMALGQEQPRSLVEAAWTRGGVHGPNLEIAYSDQAYERLARYLTKDFETTPRGQRRYFTAKGMRPQVSVFYARNEGEALRIAGDLFGAEPHWSSDHGGAAVYFFPVPTPQLTPTVGAARPRLHLAG